MTTAVQTAPAPAAKGEEKRVVYRPFRVGVAEIDDDPYDVSVTLTDSARALTPVYDVPSSGFLSGFYMLVEHTVTASTATATSTSTGVGVAAEDGPFNVIDNLRFTDTGGSDILGSITGYDLYVINKYGGYFFNDDPKSSTGLYSVTSNATASSSAAGSFRFMLRIPIELVPRDALGTLPNKSQSTPFKVAIRIAGISDVFANSATVGGTLRVRIAPVGYWEPTATDGSGNPVAQNPPGVNTTQYWSKNDYVVPSGKSTVSLTNSVGYPIRNLVFIHRDDNGSRSAGESDWPDDFILQLQSNVIHQRFKLLWAKRMQEAYGVTHPATDAAGARDNGVWVLPFCWDFGHKPGWETRRGYLRTTEGMKLLVKGSFGGPGVLTVLTNYIGVGAGSTLASITT